MANVMRCAPANSPEVHSWSRAWRGLRLRGSGEPVRNALLAAYQEPHRKYHTLQHLDECLSQFDAVRHLGEYPSEVELGLWFHDAIYDVARSDNEQRSADWAGAALVEAGAPASVVERVELLILATRHTGAPTAPDEQLLVDIDLAILGADADRFAEYERQIRDEYGFVPRPQFESRRRAILQSFLARDRIYNTPHFHSELEARARANLECTATMPASASPPGERDPAPSKGSP